MAATMPTRVESPLGSNEGMGYRMRVTDFAVLGR